MNVLRTIKRKLTGYGASNGKRRKKTEYKAGEWKVKSEITKKKRRNKHKMKSKMLSRIRSNKIRFKVKELKKD